MCPDTARAAPPHRRRTAATAAPICATASPTTEPVGVNRSRSPPPAARRSTQAKVTRIDSACAAYRSSQPRTVEAGRPAALVIVRHPCPAERASDAAEITPTTSTRRPRQNRGNSTCERPQPGAGGKGR